MTLVIRSVVLNSLEIYNLLVFIMLETLLHAILEQVDQPKKDLEKNLRALLNEAVEKLDLVSKQEIERQHHALHQANLRLKSLQEQVTLLEQQIHNKK
ncbi:conserved hypothetical protein [Acinetobacter baylyi ADP1]|uniref:Membrane fusogenic activity n=2 Tax=Moraxellaceae TaxID=468 RepID=Q6FFE8_ACIAD|nr:conserved hypothetical protein [Acinetobacter baylyi ADP1]